MSRALSILLCLLTLNGCLPAFAQLRVDFAPDKSGGCSPLILHFTNTTSGASAAATYLWDFGNGNTAAVSNAQAVYVEEGDYTVTLTVHDGSASSSATHTITVYGKPKPTFSFSPGTVCGPQPITFTAGGDAGSGSMVRWLWDFGDGSTMQSFGVTAQHVYAQSIATPVSLTVTNSYGCVDTIKQPVQVTVLTPATSAFTSDKRVLCLVTDPVQFTSNSTGPAPLTYSWDFGDGTGSTLKNPGHSYSQRGTYPVTLTTTASNGCTATAAVSNYLNVANYTTDFDAPTAAFCQNSSAYFTDKSTPAPDNRQWLVDGVPSYSYSPMQYYFSTPGAHTIQLNNTFGNCPQSATKTVTVNAVPAGVAYDMSQTTACDHVTVAFTDKTVGSLSWNWNFNYYYNGVDQSSPGNGISHDFSYGVTYGVRMTVTNAAGCSNSYQTQLYFTKPVISINEPNPTPSGSCNQPITKTYTITNLSELSSWTWDFGDGTTSTDASPTHVWSSPGSYTIVLRYIDKNGCSGMTNSLNVIISSPMTLDFSSNITTVCAGSPVNFSSPSLAAAAAAPGAGGMNISWSFGDGSGSGNFNPTYSYHSAGVYTVLLNVRNGGGCIASASQPNYITVLEQPGTYGGHSYTCNGDRNVVTFTYTPGTATSVVWNFGDGSSQTTDASTTTITHPYPATGTYNLEIMASNGTCSHGNSDRVYVLKKQHLKLTAATNTVCASGTLDVSLAAERNPSQTYNGYYYDYAPQFLYADGTPFTGSAVLTTPYDAYSNGAFHYTLSGFKPGESGLQVITTSSYFNCTDPSNILPLTIQGSATAAFTIVNDNRCFQSPVVLQDASTPGVNNTIVSERWDFGDGAFLSQIGGTVSHTYTNPGQYAVKLTLADAAGCTAYSGANQSYVSVNGPKASFSPNPGTDVNLNTTMYFSNTTNTYGSNNTVWSWDFGDGSPPSTDYSPTHTYTVPGKYTVTLTASNPGQPNTCVTSATTVINVKNFNSHFSTTPTYVGNASCPPVLAQFYNTSVNYQRVSWDFGDGWTAGNLNAPSHVYQQSGRYIVTLFVTGFNGLTAKYIDSVFVRAPAASLSAATPVVCQGQPAVYAAKATASKSYAFDFGDGSVGSAAYPDSVMAHNYTSSGDYVARLIVTDTFGCQAAADMAVKLKVHPVPTVVISPAEPYVCKDGLGVTLTASGGQDYVWSPATGLDRTDVASPVASPSRDTKYQVLVTDDAGCHNTGEVTVEVTVKQEITISPDSTSVCEGDAVRLIAKGADYYSWLGDVLGQGGPGSVTARPAVSTVYTVIGQDVHHCFNDTANVIVTVLPVPSVNGGPDVEVLAGSPVTLTAAGSADVIRWEWTPADYLSCTDCSQPVASPKKPEHYVVAVFNAVGCSVRDTVEAKILCEASRVRVPDAFSPNGDGHNDRWVILGIGLVKHVVVYNRWGLKLFERNNFYPADAVDCWDGNFNGQPAPVGAYAYYIEMECPTGGVFGRRGTVVLVR